MKRPFASGNDVPTLYPSSVVTGGFNSGGGTNTLTLTGEAGSSDTLTGGISNFQTLTKTGPGTWALQGSVGNNGGNAALAVNVQQGTLALTGDNTNFNGTGLVNPADTLEARAQSLPPGVTDNWPRALRATGQLQLRGRTRRHRLGRQDQSRRADAVRRKQLPGWYADSGRDRRSRYR